MSNNKQSSVEWLFPKVLELTLQLSNKRISQRGCELKILELFEQAKAMHKEEIFDYIKQKYCIGHKSLEFHRLEFEQYYEQTYGGNK